MIWLQRIWWLTFAALIFQAAYYYPHLPEQLASHFDSSGAPDGYSSRTEFIITWFLAVLAVNIGPLIIGPVLRKISPRLINAPNKEYWLATPIRRETLIDTIRNMLAGAILGANVILLLAFQYTVYANLGHPDRLPMTSIWLAVAFELLLSLASIAWGLIKLANPPQSDSTIPPS